MVRPSTMPAQPPSAWNRRAEISRSTLGATAAPTPATVKSVRPMISVGRRPKWSANGP
jgi:hypothetical protein